MKVVCEISNVFDLDDDSVLDRVKRYILLSDGQTNLVQNEEYCVYGIAFRDNHPWYYLCLGEDDDSPTAYPAELFKIIDGKLSSYWMLSTEESSIVFEEWANDSSFYERLVDDDPTAIAQFKRYQTLMNNE